MLVPQLKIPVSQQFNTCYPCRSTRRNGTKKTKRQHITKRQQSKARLSLTPHHLQELLSVGTLDDANPLGGQLSILQKEFQHNEPGNGGEGGGGIIMHGRSFRNSRIPTIPERSMSGFHRPGGRCLHLMRSAAVNWSVSRTHQGWASSFYYYSKNNRL